MCQKQQRSVGAWEINLKSKNNLIINNKRTDNVKERKSSSILLEHSLCYVAAAAVVVLDVVGVAVVGFTAVMLHINVYSRIMCETLLLTLTYMFSIKWEWKTSRIRSGWQCKYMTYISLVVYSIYNAVCTLCWVTLWVSGKTYIQKKEKQMHT